MEYTIFLQSYNDAVPKLFEIKINDQTIVYDLKLKLSSFLKKSTYDIYILFEDQLLAENVGNLIKEYDIKEKDILKFGIFDDTSKSYIHYDSIDSVKFGFSHRFRKH
jgi:hypothetical protein